MSTLTRTIVGVAALGFGACGAEPAVEPTEYADVAQILASSLSSDSDGGVRGAIDDVAKLAYGGVPAGFTLDRLGWASGRHGDATYTFRVTCADVTGRTLPVCDSTTDRATAIAAWSGVTRTIAYDSQFNRTALWQLEHLQTGLGTITGVSQFGSQATFGVIGTPATYTLTTAFDEHYLVDTSARNLMAAELRGDLAVVHDGARLDIAALITIDVGATTAAIQLDGDQVREVNLDTSFQGE
jgi:hypothetical protein